MKWMRNKLRSQKGASLILALLFFLLCVMVGATVLAAASSNAGKTRERWREQQEYFTVSSALQLVCGRLEKVEYKANASVSEGKIEVQPDPGDTATWYDYVKTNYEQEVGTVTFDTDGAVDGYWNAILGGLRKELDGFFAEGFTGAECSGYHGNGSFQDDHVHVHAPLSGTSVASPTDHLLYIEVKPDASSGGALPGDALEELTKKVEVKVCLGKPGALGDERYWLFLEARLKDGRGKYVMKAELEPTGSFPHINKPSTYDGPYPGLDAGRAEALKWKLVRIYKEL